MPNLLAMSFEGDLSPSFDLRCLRPGRNLPDGWGIGYYPGGEPSAAVLKEPSPREGGSRSELVRAWEHAASSIFALHIRAARWGSPSDANTQPFARAWGKRDWMFMHSGSLEQRLETDENALFQPVGSTDTETIFCELMTRLAERQTQRLRDLDPQTLHAWLGGLNKLGVLTCAITDGSDLAVYTDATGAQPVWVWRLLPPYERVCFSDDDLSVDLTRRGAKARKGQIVTTSQLTADQGAIEPDWQERAPGSLLVIRQGEVVADVGRAAPAQVAVPAAGEGAFSPAPPGAPIAPPAADTDPAVRRGPSRPRSAPARRLEIEHVTVYRYEQPVERSTHLLRLQPADNRTQRLVAHDLQLSVDAKWRDYDDVFGNRVRRVMIETPFTELAIRSRALVLALDTNPIELRPLHARTTIPLNWMPWQRHMLGPYLLPPELPEPQLVELHEYAMSFVERNGYDLIDSLLDLNLSIFRDYAYRQGSTTVFTTPFEVYTRREGVCQDFTNLFICLARLLGIPARYVSGYLYTGPKATNRAMAEATHAWAQVYLPEHGWTGFDPTNGVLTQTDHVRVAIGRNYLDATPTGGTIFVGGGGETLEVKVTVEEDG